MIPPVEDGVLQSNPDFALLYAKLTTSVLNPDGSTKNQPSTKQRRAVSEVGSLGSRWKQPGLDWAGQGN